MLDKIVEKLLTLAVVDMQKTKLFVASSAGFNNTDLTEIDGFIRRLNDYYIDRGIYFTPVFSTEITDAESRNREIAEGSVAFFLLDSDCAEQSARQGSLELEEIYKAAHDSYNKTGKPRIVLYSKTQGSWKREQDYGDENLVGQGLAPAASSVPPIVPSPNNSQFSILNSQFTNTYTHVDTLKLGILMQIKQLDLPGVDIRLKDGKAWQGSDALLSLENVESITGYENLQSLKQRRAELESRYYAAKTKYAENPGDPTAYDEFFEASKQRSDAMQQIQDIEYQLYHLIEGMYVQTAQGKLSSRQVEGYKLIERGKFIEAKTILDFDEIVNDGRKKDEMVKQAAHEAQILVNELLQLKDINATLFDWDAVGACYKEAARLEEKHNLPWRATITLDPAEIDYLNYLITQYRHKEAAELGEKLRMNSISPSSAATDEERSYILNLLGIIYYETNRTAEAEDTLKEALAIRSARIVGAPDTIAKDIAIVYNNLANTYYYSSRYDEAIEAHKSALEIREMLAKLDPDAHEEYLAYTYFNLGEVYCEIKKYKESSEFVMAALEIFRKLAEKKPDIYEEFLSLCHHSLGVTYTRLQCYTEFESQFDTALKIQIKQMENNPGVYETRVAASYYEYGKSYIEAKRYMDAEEKLKAALGIYKRLASRTPEVFEPDLAKCYSSFGGLYKETKRYMEAADSLQSAIQIYKKYKDTNPSFSNRIADAQKLLGSVNEAQKRHDGAFALFTQEEKEVALLLTEGKTKSEIIRKLRLPTEEINDIIASVRKKISAHDDPDPLIDAIATEFKLTKREADMLKYLQRTAGNELIASELFISEETVRIHVRKLLKKLSIENRKDVAFWLESRVL